MSRMRYEMKLGLELSVVCAHIKCAVEIWQPEELMAFEMYVGGHMGRVPSDAIGKCG